MMKRLALLVLLAAFVGCSCLRQQTERLPEIHPKVFSMVECWLSDTQEPVVTEINLDAVSNNGNQFYGKLTSDGTWTRVDGEDGRGFMRYRVIEKRGNTWYVEFQNNGGGSLTTSTIIGFTLSHRTFKVDRKQTRIRIVRIDSMERNIQHTPAGDVLKAAPEE